MNKTNQEIKKAVEKVEGEISKHSVIELHIMTKLNSLSEKDFDKEHGDQEDDVTNEVEKDLHRAIFKSFENFMQDSLEEEVMTGDYESEFPEKVQDFSDFGSITLNLSHLSIKDYNEEIKKAHDEGVDAGYRKCRGEALNELKTWLTGYLKVSIGVQHEGGVEEWVEDIFEDYEKYLVKNKGDDDK